MTESRTDHSELDLLSAYLDGELEPAERAHLQEHLPGCAECAEVLAALRATLADLAGLAQPELDDASIAALDARLAAERAASHRRIGRGWAWASGGVAASLVALIAVFAIVRAPSVTGPEQSSLSAGAVARSLGAPVVASGTDYTADTARQALARFLGASDGDLTAGRQAKTGAASESNSGQYNFATTNAAPGARAEDKTVLGQDPSDSEQLARCDQAVRSGTALRPLQYEIARYEGRDAYLLFYSTDQASRIELYVVRRSDCFTLYFTEQPA